MNEETKEMRGVSEGASRKDSSPHGDDEGAGKDLVLSERQIRWSIVLALLAVLFALAAGYYWGRATGCSEFMQGCQDDLFNDKITAAIYELTGEPSAQAASEAASAGARTADDVERAGLQTAPVDPNELSLSGAPDTEEVAGAPAQASLAQTSLAQALVAGFGNRQAAQEYVRRLVRRNIPAQVIERSSVTKRRRKAWYQVAVGPLERQQLQALVQMLIASDKLSGVVIEPVKG